MFKNASGFNVGNVSHIKAGTYIDARDSNHHPAATNPLKDLYENIAVGALHNSAERHDAPKCHEQTRIAVQQDIFSWMGTGDQGPRPRQLLWLSGPAGAGKSAIMGTVADECQRRGQLAASFFFSVSSANPDRRSKRCFVTTLAYQLQQDGVLKEPMSSMLSSISNDPAIFQKSLKEQVEVLILNPLRVSRGTYDITKVPKIIIIDGPDECDESLDPTHPAARRSKEQNQTEILSVLFHALDEPAFPFDIILASRPEPWIRRFFTAPTITGRTTEIFLHNNYDPDKDIALFLRSKFAELRRWYGLPDSWPGERVVLRLVGNASGQFIYAATVMRFIETPSNTPEVQLDIVLSLRPEDMENPFGPLDALYSRCLRSSPKPDLAFIWLRAHQIITAIDGIKLSAWFFNRLCESSTGEAHLVLGTLPSLIQLPSSSRDSYTFYHKSFLEFLEDPRRCQAFAGVGKGDILQWICERFGQTLVCSGPEVPIEAGRTRDFFAQFFDVWERYAAGKSRSFTGIPEDMLSRADPTFWVGKSHSQNVDYGCGLDFRRDIYLIAHGNCRLTARCRSACKSWRKAILDDPIRGVPLWSRWTLAMDRFCVQRIPPRPPSSWHPTRLPVASSLLEVPKVPRL